QSQTREGTCNRRQKLCFWSIRIGRRHLRHSSENEECDLPYSSTKAPRDKTMAEFVKQDTREEAEGADGTRDPIDVCRVIRGLEREISGRERPGEEKESNKPGLINSDANPRNGERIYCSHVTSF